MDILMAVQLELDELKGVKSYPEWLIDKVKYDGIDLNLCGYLYGTDFEFTMENGVDEDGIQARNAMDLRMTYAKEVGQEAGRSERDIDRIWKSVHGKCSVLELIVYLCVQIDALVNEGESGAMVPMFFEILVRNLRYLKRSEVVVVDGSKWSADDALRYDWEIRTGIFMERMYNRDGTNGGLFPITGWREGISKDMRKVSIWYQMNAWLEENLDDDGVFLVPEWMKEKDKN